MQTILRAVAAVVIVAAVGFALARAGRGSSNSAAPSAPALSGHAQTASFRVSYPADWHRLTSAPSGLQPALSDPLSLAPTQSGQELVIGGLTTGSAAPGRLPATLQEVLSTPPKAQLVSLGGQRFSRYLNLSPRGQNITESVYLLPTTAGTIGAVCAAQKPSAAFVGSCERLLATLRPTAGTVVSAGVDPTYAQRLNAIVATLNAARTTVGSKLRTGSLRARARAAAQLAAAHARASTAAGRLSPTGDAMAAANRALVTALGQTASAYRALGTAILQRHQAAYRSAEASLSTGARALAAAFTRLRGLGYAIS
jgi:hypothetical protein